MEILTLRQPDDWHLHLRDGKVLADTVPHTARQFARAIVMPNLKPPVTTVVQALDYRQRILQTVPDGLAFDPLMTLYLTDSTTPDEVRSAKEHPEVHAFKLYPAGATTHSDSGLSNLESAYRVLEEMERCDVPLLIHGEVVDPTIDIFDREKLFIGRELIRIQQRFPSLRIVMEHITTKDAVDYVKETPATIAATITAHHLLFNRNAMLAGGIRPHYFCLPILKRESHRLALVDAATSGNSKFFLGTDSAPHSVKTKEATCGCAGCFTAYTAIELYAMAFEAAGKLQQLEAFASLNGPNFYGLPANTKQIVLKKSAWRIPESLPFGDETITPMLASDIISWKLQDPEILPDA